MVFQIPQFIDVEDRIVAALTIRQLIYIVAAGVVIVLAFSLLPFLPALFVGLIGTAICVSFAFIKYNGQRLSQIAISAIIFLWKPRLYLWKREVKQQIVEITEEEEKEAERVVVEKRKNLQEFSINMPLVKKLWSDIVTTKNPIPKREKKIIEPTVTLNVFRKSSGETGYAKRVDYR